MRWVSSRRWSSRSQRCISCVRRCSIAWSGCQLPQRDALRTAFGVSPGPAPDLFFVGLAVLNLLSEVAEERPLICLVDDEQWLDHASAQALAFVARRLEAESVGLVFAARAPSELLAGLPELVVEGLAEGDARALLDSVLTGPLDTRVRDQIVTETRGNPLALLELLKGLTPAELAGGFALPSAMPLSQDASRRASGGGSTRYRRETRRLLQLAAADPVGEPSLVWRAAERLGIRSEAATPAAEAGLLEFGPRVRFRHPLVRSAVYRSASLQERQDVHRALAEATDPESDPDRRAWHRAQAAPGPDEDVAEELERSAGRAQARGGFAAAAAFLERAALLTAEPARRAAAAARGGRREARRRRARRRARPARRSRGRAARRAPARPCRPPARTDRAGAATLRRRRSAARQRRQTSRVARRKSGARDARRGARGRDGG